jgi:hypothetical protein
VGSTWHRSPLTLYAQLRLLSDATADDLLYTETMGHPKASRAHWQRKLDVLTELCPQFEAKGDEWLHSFRPGKAETHARTIGRRSRYLYRVQL